MKNKENTADRAKNKLGAVDIIVIVIVAAGIIAAVYFGVVLLSGGIDFSRGKTSKEANIEYGIRIENVDTEVFAFVRGSDNTVGSAFLQVGDTVYDRASGKAIGRVAAMTYENSKASTGVPGSTGGMIYAETPGFIDVTITVEAATDAGKDPYVVNGFAVRVGENVAFRTYGYYAEGEIVYMTEKTNEETDGN